MKGKALFCNARIRWTWSERTTLLITTSYLVIVRTATGIVFVPAHRRAKSFYLFLHTYLLHTQVVCLSVCLSCHKTQTQTKGQL